MARKPPCPNWQRRPIQDREVASSSLAGGTRNSYAIHDLTQSQFSKTLTVRFVACIIHIVPMLITTRLQPTAMCGLPRLARVWSVVDHTAVRDRYLGCSSFAIEDSERKQANPRRDP